MVYDDLRRAAPFGEGNPAPVLFTGSARVVSFRAIGAGEKHLRLVFRDGDQSFTGLWWGAGATRLEPGEFELFYRLGLNCYNGEEILQVVVEYLGPQTQAPAAKVAAPILVRRPLLIDRRGNGTALPDFPETLVLAEGAEIAAPAGAVDRYRLGPATDLLLLTPPPSPGLLDEAIALTGASRLILAWPTAAPPDEERFLPTLMRLLAVEMQRNAYISVSRLAVATAELEAVVRLTIDALVESDLLAIEEEGADVLRLRRRADGRGIRESASLRQMRTLLSESRAFRRFLRTASLNAVKNSLR